jgi:hypothetical protein
MQAIPTQAMSQNQLTADEADYLSRLRLAA